MVSYRTLVLGTIAVISAAAPAYAAGPKALPGQQGDAGPKALPAHVQYAGPKALPTRVMYDDAGPKALPGPNDAGPKALPGPSGTINVLLRTLGSLEQLIQIRL